MKYTNFIKPLTMFKYYKYDNVPYFFLDILINI